MSLTESLLSKPSRFQELTSQESSALSHLVAALALVKSTDSADSPTLGTQAELYPLVAGFKRFQGSKGHLREVEDEAARQKKAAEDEDAGDKNDGEGDAFNLDDGEEEVSGVQARRETPQHRHQPTSSPPPLPPPLTR